MSFSFNLPDFTIPPQHEPSDPAPDPTPIAPVDVADEAEPDPLPPDPPAPDPEPITLPPVATLTPDQFTSSLRGRALSYLDRTFARAEALSDLQISTQLALPPEKRDFISSTKFLDHLTNLSKVALDLTAPPPPSLAPPSVLPGLQPGQFPGTLIAINAPAASIPTPAPQITSADSSHYLPGLIEAQKVPDPPQSQSQLPPPAPDPAQSAPPPSPSTPTKLPPGARVVSRPQN